MTTAVYDVDVSWEPSTWWYQETFGNTAYDDITADVKSISIRRGRSSDMGQMQQGVCTIRLADATGKYNPENASSVLNGYLFPLRPIRVRAVYSTVTYPLFYGYITRIEHDPNPSVKESTIEAVDFSSALNDYPVDIASMPGDPGYTNAHVGTLIHDIVYLSGLDPDVWSDCDPGGIISSYAPDGTTSALSCLQELIQIDQGNLFIAADGVVTYQDASARYAQQTAVATFTGAMVSGLRATITDDGVINNQAVTNETTSFTYTAQYQAPAGQAAWFPRYGTAISSDLFVSDDHARNLAEFITNTRGGPISPARQMVMMNGDATRLTQMLARELGDFVTINETAGGTSFSGTIAAIEHDIWEGGRFHRTTFAVEKQTVAFFTVGAAGTGSTIDSADIIGY